MSEQYLLDYMYVFLFFLVGMLAAVSQMAMDCGWASGMPKAKYH